jgi:tetratricopeptide (TPR) repeat protein
VAGCSRDPNVQKVKYLESGKRYEKEGKFKEASIQFANALKADKNYSDAHYELGKTYIHLSMMQAAYGELQRAVELSPSNVQARLDLGNLALAGKQLDVAVVQAKAILAQKPSSADAYELLANVAIKKGDASDALTQINHAIALDPNHASFHATLGMLQSVNPETLEVSKTELTKAVQLDPANVLARIGLASVLERKGDIQGAEQQLLAAISASPKNMQVRVHLAGLYLRAKNQPKAEATLQQATDELFDNAEGAELLKSYYTQTGQMDRAESAYADLTAKHPESLNLKIAYAHILIARNKLQQAKDIVAKLVKDKGSDPQVAVLNGMLLLNDGKVDEAYDVLQTATKNAPESPTVTLWYGMASRAKGDIPTAQQSFQQVLRMEPTNFGAQKGMAEIAGQRGDMSLLRQVAESTIATYPNMADGYVWRGTAEANDKQMDKAADDFQTALKKNPKDSVALLQLAQVRIIQKRIPEANTLLAQAVEANGNPGALHLLVVSDMQAKQPAKAITRIQEQIGKYPQNGALYGELALVQLSQKDLTGAITNSQKAMQLNPADQTAVKIYTQSMIASGNVGPAISKWQQWSAAHPKDPQALSILGMLEEATGDQAKAMEYYKTALSIQPEQATAANNLAYLMVENNQNLDVALTLAQTARRGMPNSSDTSDTLAWVYFHKGAYESARTLLEDSLKTDPNNATIHYHLGMTYSRLNKKADAEMHLNKAISLAPNTQTMKDATQELQRLG